MLALRGLAQVLQFYLQKGSDFNLRVSSGAAEEVLAVCCEGAKEQPQRAPRVAFWGWKMGLIDKQGFALWLRQGSDLCLSWEWDVWE